MSKSDTKARLRDKLLEGARSAPGEVADEAYFYRLRARALDPNERTRQKQAARDEDARKLANGEVSPAELARKNGFFSECDLAGSDIVLPSGKILPGRR